MRGAAALERMLPLSFFFPGGDFEPEGGGKEGEREPAESIFQGPRAREKPTASGGESLELRGGDSLEEWDWP